MKKIRLFLVTFCIFIFIISLNHFAMAYPLIGHQFYGYAGSGTTVTAIVGDNSFSATVNAEGYYGYDNVFFIDAASDNIDGAENGDTITFYLDDKKLATYIFKIAGVTKLDFADDPATAEEEVIEDGLGVEDLTLEGDSDGDGLTDEEEESYGTDPNDADTDDDGLSDSKEISEDTDPNDKDTDDDGITDYEEVSSRSSKKKSITEEITGDTGCYHKWKCTTWSECAENGFQTRICFYTGNCTREGNQSDTRQRCTYISKEEEVIPEIEETCFDGVQNQGERGIDCGGPCEVCHEIVKVIEKPKTNWWYILLAIILLLLIIIVIVGYKYKDRLKPVWDKFISKFRKKPKAVSLNQKFL